MCKFLLAILTVVVVVLFFRPGLAFAETSFETKCAMAGEITVCVDKLGIAYTINQQGEVNLVTFETKKKSFWKTLGKFSRDLSDDLARNTSEIPNFKAEVIEAHLKFLADDLLEGREAGTRGYDLAAKYVETQFKALGLEPAGDNGTYFQNVPLQKSTLVDDSVSFSLTGPEGNRTFENGKDIIIMAGQYEANQAVKGEVVFAGFGVVAPGMNHNDYEGLDVEGKVVVIFSGAPKFFPSEVRAHYGSSLVKSKSAAERGAIAILSFYTPSREQIFPFERAKAFAFQPRMTWVGPDQKPFVSAPEIKIWATLGPKPTSFLFADAEFSYEELMVLAEDEEKSPKGFVLNKSVDMSRKTSFEIISSPNVAGLIPGSDPELGAEIVLISSHLDHVGIGVPVDGDAIYNGALDNASGVATMLEVARVFSQAPIKPKRSILFLAVTAEEKGLLGSDYFAHYPTKPIEKIIANVNLDGVLAFFDFVDIIGFGASHSTLGATAGTAAEKAGVILSPDPMPEQGIFTRSDHYSFVKQGIPSIFFLVGFGENAEGINGAEVFSNAMQNSYHQPSDDLNQPIIYEVAAKFAKINWLMINDLANAGELPTWYEGDFFGNQFAPDAKKTEAIK